MAIRLQKPPWETSEELGFTQRGTVRAPQLHKSHLQHLTLLRISDHFRLCSSSVTYHNTSLFQITVFAAPSWGGEKMWREGKNGKSVSREKQVKSWPQSESTFALLTSSRAVTFLWHASFAMPQRCNQSIHAACWQSILLKSMGLAEYGQSSLLVKVLQFPELTRMAGTPSSYPGKIL